MDYLTGGSSKQGSPFYEEGYVRDLERQLDELAEALRDALIFVDVQNGIGAKESAARGRALLAKVRTPANDE